MLTWKQSFEAADALLSALRQAKDEEAELFLEDCCGSGTGSGMELYESRATEALGGLGFDPTIIITIITTLLPIILDCFKQKPTVPMFRFRALRTRAMVAQALRNA